MLIRVPLFQMNGGSGNGVRAEVLSMKIGRVFFNHFKRIFLVKGRKGMKEMRVKIENFELCENSTHMIVIQRWM